MRRPPNGERAASGVGGGRQTAPHRSSVEIGSTVSYALRDVSAMVRNGEARTVVMRSVYECAKDDACE